MYIYIVCVCVYKYRNMDYLSTLLPIDQCVDRYRVLLLLFIYLFIYLDAEDTELVIEV